MWDQSQGAEDCATGQSRLGRNCSRGLVNRHRAIAKPPNRLLGSQEEFKQAERCVGVEMTTVTFLVSPLDRPSLPIPCLSSQGGLEPGFWLLVGTRWTQSFPRWGSWLVASRAWLRLSSSPSLTPFMSRQILPKSSCRLISPGFFIFRACTTF